MLAQIVDMVAQAQRSRAPIQRLADKVAGWFVPAVIGIAAVTFVAWALFGPEPRFAHAIVNAVAVLIIACPCALGLATPMSIMVGVGRGAQAGVLIKEAEAIERMEKVETLVVDKTGTLTEGKPRYEDHSRDPSPRKNCSPQPPPSSAQRTSAGHRAGSRREERGIKPFSVTNFKSTTGGGVSGASMAITSSSAMRLSCKRKAWRTEAARERCRGTSGGRPRRDFVAIDGHAGRSRSRRSDQGIDSRGHRASASASASK